MLVGQLPGYPVSDSSYCTYFTECSIKFNMSPHVIFMCSLLAVTCSVSQLRFSSQKWPSVDTSFSVLDESLNQAECSAAVLASAFISLFPISKKIFEAKAFVQHESPRVLQSVRYYESRSPYGERKYR